MNFAALRKHGHGKVGKEMRTREETHAPVLGEFWILLYLWEVDARFIYTSIPEVSISYFEALTYLEAWMLENHHKPCYFY
jgi:hypothetical protein